LLRSQARHQSHDIEDRPGGGARMRVRIPSAPSETRLDGDDR
jgi:hypothetical protein